MWKLLKPLTLLLLPLVLVACTEEEAVISTQTPPDIPPVDTTRPEDPGLSYASACLATGPIPNELKTGGRPLGIPALTDPEFLTATAAGYMNPEDYVFGVELLGRFFAFPAKVLNYHEIVTFSVDSYRYTASWCPLAFSFVEARNQDWIDAPRNRRNSFQVSGALMDNNLVMFDSETHSTYPQLLVTSNAGSKEGTCLELGRNTVATTWDIWLRLHPETVVLTNQNDEKTSIKPEWYFTNPYEAYHRGTEPLLYLPTFPDDRLPERQVVFGVHAEEGRAAAVLRKPVAHAEIGKSSVVFFHEPVTHTAFAFQNNLDDVVRTFEIHDPDERGLPQFQDVQSGTVWSFDGIGVEGPLAGRRLAQMPSLALYWFAWSTFFPENPILFL